MWVLQQNRVVVWGVRSGLVWIGHEGGACGAAEGRLPWVGCYPTKNRDRDLQVNKRTE